MVTLRQRAVLTGQRVKRVGATLGSEFRRIGTDPVLRRGLGFQSPQSVTRSKPRRVKRRARSVNGSNGISIRSNGSVITIQKPKKAKRVSRSRSARPKKQNGNGLAKNKEFGQSLGFAGLDIGAL